MQILLIMLIVVLLAFSVLLLALAKQSPREKQTEDKNDVYILGNNISKNPRFNRVDKHN